MAWGTATVLLTDSTAKLLWAEPGPELEDVLAGDGRLGMGDGVSEDLRDELKINFFTSWIFNRFYNAVI